MIAADFADGTATIAVRPEYGHPVTFVIVDRTVNVARPTGSYVVPRRASRFVVALKGSTGAGFSAHTSFDAACKSALHRARRYDRAYSVPRGLAVAS